MGKRETKPSGRVRKTGLMVHVKPGARSNQITGILEDGSIKIQLTAPPVEGKANEALLKFISKVLDIPPSQVTIVTGFSARMKLILVEGLSDKAVQERIENQLKK